MIKLIPHFKTFKIGSHLILSMVKKKLPSKMKLSKVYVNLLLPVNFTGLIY